MIDLTPVLQAVLGLIAALITVFLLPYLKNKLSAEKLTSLAEWVAIGVTAAEQIYNGSGRGEEKKAYVLDFLIGKGYSVDLDSVSDSINALIEAAVYELKND